MSGLDARAAQREAGRWLVHAEEDLRVARLALAAAPPLVRPAAYHAQQAAEKLLKALLVLHGTAVPRTHDLAHLLSLTGPPPGMDAAAAEEIAAISPWSVATRYPGLDDVGQPLAAEVAAILPLLDGLARAVAAIAAR